MVESVDDDCEFILWTTHDTMTITDNFYDLFQSKLDQLENFGVIGFNIIFPFNVIFPIKILEKMYWE